VTYTQANTILNIKPIHQALPFNQQAKEKIRDWPSETSV